MKEKLFKFKVSSAQYGALLDDELDVIKRIIGDYEIVKIRHCPMGFDMKVWCKKKPKADKSLMNEIVDIVNANLFAETKLAYIRNALRDYGFLPQKNGD